MPIVFRHVNEEPGLIDSMIRRPVGSHKVRVGPKIQNTKTRFCSTCHREVERVPARRRGPDTSATA